MTVRYENGNSDRVHGPFDISQNGASGRCVSAISVAGDDVDTDTTPGRPNQPSYARVDLIGHGRLIARPEAPVVVRPVPQPPLVVRPAPRYGTQTRYILARDQQELIANPQIQESYGRNYSVFFSNPERVGAIQLEAKYDDAFIDDITVTFANGESQRIELGGYTTEGWVYRDGEIHLARNQRTGMLDLTGFGNRRVTSVSVRGRDGARGEVQASGVKPVIAVHGIGMQVVTEQVCVANCN